MAIANSAILLLLIGDSASTLVGRRWGKHKLPFNKFKSYEGSLAFLSVGFLCSMTLLPIVPAFFGATIGALTEAYSPIDDNIPIPIISALAMTLAFYLI
jgi:dolichol kinase